MTVDFLASEPHFAEHLAPVWRGLDDGERGRFYCKGTLRRRMGELGIPASFSPIPRRDSPIVVASWGDLKLARATGRPVIYMEHGAGQSYVGTAGNGSYVGASDRNGVIAVLSPNQQAADRQDAAHPTIPVHVVGCPKLDAMISLPPVEDGAPAIAHHWDCMVVPETRSAWHHYYRSYRGLADRYGTVIGHAHPRLWPRIRHTFHAQGLRPVQHFADVITRASMLAVDNSSVLFEFAALDRPVVVLNAPWYRRDVDHGGRFWDWADIGVQVDEGADLAEAFAIAGRDEFTERRREIIADVYPNLGVAVPDAVAAIRTTL